MTPTNKESAVTLFLQGRSVTDVAAFYAITRTTMEQVLREAIWQLSGALVAARSATADAATAIADTPAPSVIEATPV